MIRKHRTHSAETAKLTRRVAAATVLAGAGLLAIAPAADAAVAATTQAASPGGLRPDLVGAGPNQVLLLGGDSNVLVAHVKNVGNVSAPASQATITYQPVSRARRAGQTYPSFVNTPGSTPTTATGPVDPVPSGGDVAFSASTDSSPHGWNKITVCADSSQDIREKSERNNCFSEIQDVRPEGVG